MVAALIVSSLSRSSISKSSRPCRSRAGSKQDGDQRLEAFRAEAVGCFPQRYQCLPNICAIAHWIFSGGWRTLRSTAEHSDRMLAVITGNCDELVQNPLLVGPGAQSISLDNRFDQFRPCHHANPPRHPSSEPGGQQRLHPLGTGTLSVAINVRQCGISFSFRPTQ